MQITEHRSRARGLADLLLPFALIEDGILLQQDGSLLAAWSFRGPDMHSATHAEMNALAMRFNSILRLGSGWMIHSDLIRSKAPGYPEAGAFPHPVTRVIDDERRQQFMDEGAHFESEYFLALTYLPPVESEEKFKGWMFEGQSGARSAVAKQVLDRFRSRVEMFENVFGALFRIERLGRHEFLDDHGFPQIHDRLLRYLRRCITGDDHPFALPDIPAYLNDSLAEQDFRGGIEPQVGRRHIVCWRSKASQRRASPAFSVSWIPCRWNIAGARGQFSSIPRKPALFSTRRARNGSRAFAGLRIKCSAHRTER